MTRRRRARWSVGAILALAIVSGCALEIDPPALPEVDPVAFRDEVYPLLLADCGFVACHGAAARPLRVAGPGRVRLDPDTLPYDPPTPAELALSYERARSMLADDDGVRRSLLLRKPLAVSAGGAGHAGDDPWGQSLYPDKQDPRFMTLFFWAIAGEGAP